MTMFSDYYEDVIINLMRGVAFTAVTAYVALFTAATGLEADNPTAEVSGGSYARKLAGLSAGSGGVSANAGDITFTTATAPWGTVTHVALVTHVSNVTWGTDVHVLMSGILDTQKTIGTGDTFKISAGDLDVIVT